MNQKHSIPTLAIYIFLFLFSNAVFGKTLDVVRLYVKPTTDQGIASLQQMDVRHSFSDGVHSVELPIQAAKNLVQNPNFHVLGQATPWSLIGPPNCAPWPSCKNGDGGTITDPVRVYFPSDQTPWGIEAVYNYSNISETTGGLGVTVAMLDSGAKKDHLDLVNRIADCKDFTKRKVTNNCDDTNGHGTHTAGTVAADGGDDSKGIFGVAPEAKLFIYKVCSSFCWSDDVTAAILEAEKRGAHIISMSIGGSGIASYERAAIQEVTGKNVLVIAAAGNSGPGDNTIEYPGALPEVVAVAALNSNLSVASFSSRGIDDGNDNSIVEREVEIAMPGVSVLSTWNDGAYKSISGTSMATPHASGLAAKLWTGTASGTRDALRNAAHDIGSTGYDTASGYGFPHL